MKIGIDISQIVYGTGVSRYVSTIIDALAAYDKENEYIFFFSSLRQKLSPDVKNKIMSRRWHIKQFPFPPTLLDIIWNKLHIFPINLLIGHVDLFFTSDWVEPTASFPKITTIHDMVVYKYPETSQQKTEFNTNQLQIKSNIVSIQKKRLELVKKESRLILCDSQATKDDVHELLKIPKDKLKVVYPAVEIQKPTNTDVQNTKTKYKIARPFILTVGTLQPRKNIQRLIESFQQAKIDNLELFVVGMKGWGKEIRDLQNDAIRLLGFVSDEDLRSLYSLAESFFYPSIYEGFGLPIVEAMSLGCPVATSNTSSMKEIAKGYGLLFDPFSIDEIKQSIIRLHNDNQLRSQLKEKGKVRAKDFQLQNFAKELMAVFKETVL